MKQVDYLCTVTLTPDTMPDSATYNSEAHDNKLLKQLWLDHHATLIKYCRMQYPSVNEQDADLIAINAISILCSKLAKGEKIEVENAAFLRGIVKNLVKNTDRGEKRRMEREQVYSENYLAQESKNPEEIYLDEEKRELVKSIILKLDENCRKLIDLVLQEFQPIEIYKQLGHKSPRVTSVFIVRCKDRLHTLLRESKFF
ncbi:MAG TPA: hypothetical protein PKB07_13585 [Flavilitoribacter sp.]|nr:hypothetical protein [Flavilitoribacter sp.]